jgi:hypothetical protein
MTARGWDVSEQHCPLRALPLLDPRSLMPLGPEAIDGMPGVLVRGELPFELHVRDDGDPRGADLADDRMAEGVFSLAPRAAMGNVLRRRPRRLIGNPPLIMYGTPVHYIE